MVEYAVSTVDDCKIVQLPKIHNRAGNITIVENKQLIPFDVKRLYYLYDIPSGEIRGGHSHKVLLQLIVSVSGSFDVKVDDGKNQRTFSLNRPDIGLLIVPGIWRELVNFSSGAICLVLASHEYDKTDYLRNYEHFVKTKLNNEVTI